MSADLRRRTDWVLGVESRMRTRVAAQLLAWAVYLGCDAALLVGMSLGVVSKSSGWLFIFASCATQFIIYLLLRSGLSAKLADPSLMGIQSLLSLTMVAIGYAVAGPLRSCALMLAVMVIVYAMFALTPRQTLGLGLYAVLSIGLSMGIMSSAYPQEFPPQEEWLHFGVVAVTLPVASMLAQYVSHLNEKWRRGQQALHDALSQAQVLATRDPLTGLINRRHMLEMAAIALEHERMRGHAFCLAIIDLDGFRRINDEHGDPIADELLRAFARVAVQTLRHSDVASRWGGDEFLVLMTETKLDHALLGLERLRTALTQAKLLPELPQVQLKFSAGLVAHQSGDSLEITLERAGCALQEAKTGGGDRVECVLGKVTPLLEGGL